MARHQHSTRPLAGLALAVALSIALPRGYASAVAPGGGDGHDHVKEGWTAWEYPHPRDPAACGRPPTARTTAICDPDRLLHREAADRLEEVVDAARQESRIWCDATKQEHDVQIGVALMNRMVLPGFCDATVRNGCGVAAERFARDIHDKWGIGDPGCGNSVLLFLSKADRQMYILTGKAAAKRLTNADIDKVMEGMKAHLRQNQFDMAVEKGVLDITRIMARDKTWLDRIKPYIVPTLMVGTFIGVAAWKNNHSGQMRAAMQTLSRIEQEAACAAERRRGGGVVGSRWQCPVCLEDYLLDAASAVSVHVAAASNQKALWQMLHGAYTSVKTRVQQMRGRHSLEKKDSDASVPLQPGEKKSVLLRCGHRFCEECIAPWTGKGGSCPVCRTPHSPRQVSDGGEASQQQQAAAGGGAIALAGDQSHMMRMEQMEMDMNPAMWGTDDLMFRLNSLQRRYPAIVTRALVNRWRDNRVVDFRTLERDLQTSYNELARKNRTYQQTRGTGSQGSSYSGFGGGSHEGGGGSGSSW